MPGIFGIISDRPRQDCQRAVNSMLESVLYESFFRSGVLSAPEFGVYAGWTAHEDSFAAQVFTSDDGNISLLISGECFPEQEAVSKSCDGGNSRGACAGSWLVRRYEELGDRFFASL